VLVGQGDPTIIMVLKGKISSIHMEQTWQSKIENFPCQVWHAINGRTALAHNLSKKCGKNTIK
jgi:hypothetical protein